MSTYPSDKSKMLWLEVLPGLGDSALDEGSNVSS